MKRIGYLFSILILLFLSYCNSRSSEIGKLWFFTHTTAAFGDDEQGPTPASFMNLQSDHTYTRDYVGFDYGRWELKDTMLILKSTNGNTISFPITYLSGNELRLSTAKGTIVNFESQSGNFSSAAENPFSLENNQWRIRATKKESELEIKNRLLNHCLFYEVYFRWALANKLNSVDVRSTPSLIKIYGNGFALKNFEELPPSWRSYFYDVEDCRKANDLIKNIFEHHDIAWVRTDSKYKMFISAFQQLGQLIKQN